MIKNVICATVATLALSACGPSVENMVDDILDGYHLALEDTNRGQYVLKQSHWYGTKEDGEVVRGLGTILNVNLKGDLYRNGTIEKVPVAEKYWDGNSDGKVEESSSSLIFEPGSVGVPDQDKYEQRIFEMWELKRLGDE